MVIAVGQNTVTNTQETYVLFLYEKMELAGNGLQVGVCVVAHAHLGNFVQGLFKYECK